MPSPPLVRKPFDGQFVEGERGWGRGLRKGMAAVLEILDVTAPLVRDRAMTLPAGLRQFAAGARVALAGGPAPNGPLATATPQAPNTALSAGEPRPITTTRGAPAAEIPLPARPPAETTPSLPAADPAPAAPDTAAA